MKAPQLVRKKYFEQILRKSGLKITSTRLGVLQVLAASRQPLSIQELLDRVKKIDIDQATVYRMLQTLQELGVVRRIDLHNNRSYYELKPQVDHHHLVCTTCGKMEDLEGCDVDELLQRALKNSKKFSRITEHAFEVFGICKICAKKR